MSDAPRPPDGPDAPGAPGVAPTWASSDKDFVTTALGASRLWVTLGHGVLNEVYWPSTGQPRMRDLTFYLAGADRWIDLKRERRYRLSRPGPALPLPTVHHEGEGYALDLEILPDTERDAVAIRYAVEGPWRLVVVASPHLGPSGRSGQAWVDDALHATGAGASLCLAATGGFAQASAGYVGASDGWQDLSRHGRLTWSHPCAGPGNVALTGALEAPEGVIALAISDDPSGARTLARSVLAEGPDALRARLRAAWDVWRQGLAPLPDTAGPRIAEAAALSAAILRVHEDRDYPGALVASLSTPWGSSTDGLGGYHLVWPRDATLAAFAFLAAGLAQDARRISCHQIATQRPDGRWAQNLYPSGAAYWDGVQLDEAAFPVLLAAKLRERGGPELAGTAAMVRSAVRFVAREGPSSRQDRWEENPGINPFTLAVAIAALVAAAPWLEAPEREEALDLADEWCARIEEWCYVADSRWTRELGVAGHYVRIRPPPGQGDVQVRNRAGVSVPMADHVAMEFSYLVRLGLRRADDPRVADTLRVVDHALAAPTPSGTVWHRYDHDGYGEHEDGSPYDGTGIGRGWPFLAGERGHLALERGEDPTPYLETMLACASEGGLMPEQVWDADPIPERGLYPGRPSGSAMPLLWTHAEFLKLLVATREGRPVERLDAVAARYAEHRRPCAMRWRDEAPLPRLPEGMALLVEDAEPFTLHHGWDGWEAPADREATEGPFGLWRVRFEPDESAGRHALLFTRRRARGWEGADHRVELA